MKIKLELGKRYKIKYIDPEYPSASYEGIGRIDSKPHTYENEPIWTYLEDINKHGYFNAEDFIEELPYIPTKEESEIENLKNWLKYIYDAPERSLWMDSRDDAADTLVWAAEQALAGVNFNEWIGEISND